MLILVVTFLFMTRIMGQTPSLFGFYIFRVSSDSMEPTFVVGDVILVKSAEPEDIHKDDIITYKSRDGSMRGRDVTHRVVTDPVIKEDIYYYQTQGDAVGAPLDKVITYEQVEGKFLCKLSWLGKVHEFLITPKGVITLIVIIILLFGSEQIYLLLTYKYHPDEEFDDEDDDTPPDENQDTQDEK